MERLFDFDEAKRLCDSHQKILDTVMAIRRSRSVDADKVRENTAPVIDSVAISSEIDTALATGSTSTHPQPNERALISAVYTYDVGQQILSELNHFDEKIREVRMDITSLMAASSSLKWFFSNKQAKSEANTSYQRLKQLLSSDYPSKIEAISNRNRNLDNQAANAAYSSLQSNEKRYLQIIRECDKSSTKANPPSIAKTQIADAQQILDSYYSAKSQQKAKAAEAKAAVERTIQPLITERAMQELRNQEIEVLAQKRSGIRVKALREHGYKTVADAHAATIHQLSSVYGISAEAAKVIKDAAKEIANDITKTVKLTISSDEKTPAATALLRAAYRYDRVNKASDGITKSVSEDIYQVQQGINSLSELRNNLDWILGTPLERNSFVRGYRSITEHLTSTVKAAVRQYSSDVFDNSTISESWLWSDFSQRSIEYFNLLEELCPGVFGNGDTLYGLPEDLAREIQDQVYFPQGLKVTLRRYQEWGVKYILHQGKALLGDEMGLGKTVQAIATMVSLRNTGAKKFLVVCPASVLPNWCKEVEKKSQFHAVKVHGSGRQEAFDSWLINGGVAITTYETLNTLTTPNVFFYDLLVVDEAHFIKNENAIRSKNVRSFGRRAKRILFMTGTALENKVDEMISLMQVLNPGIAKQAQSIAFMSTAPQFRQLIAPVYYRRKREDVLTELPAITNTNEWCDLLPEEEDAYEKAVFNKNRSAIRKVSWVTQDLSKSAKARRLKEIVEDAKEDDRKVLVFSFYLETIERVIELLGDICTQPINGSVSVERRQEIIDEFEKMPAGSVLPAQIQAGGTGLNIQSASVVIICEPQLKPSIENQAISRAYRMGQTRKVLVYRLLASNTIDERIDDMLTEKQAIFDAFADISVAANATQKEEQQIDDKTFGKLIQEEIDRINAKNGNPRPSEQADEKNDHAPQPKETVKEAQMSSRTEMGAEKEIAADSSMQPEPKVQSEPVKSSAPVTRQAPESPQVSATEQKQLLFKDIDDFILYVNGQGILVKDNRPKNGCVWIQEDARIADLVQKQRFGEKKFYYSKKSKALGGQPGWYY